MGGRRLPPLNALRAFEVAARLGSFSAAAAELGVTHGAVSRQVAALEAWFGHRLFVRAGRSIALSGTGRTFATEVSGIFDRLAEAAAKHGPASELAIVRVSAPATFAMRWLIPRLARFHDAHPGTQVEVATTVTFADGLRGGYDLAIRRGPKTWDRHHATRFLEETDTVIASPNLLAHRPLRALSELAGHTLLSTETRPGDWPDWLTAAGLGLVSEARFMRLDHFFVTLQAASDGLGLAVGPFPVLDADVAARRFVTPFPAIRVPRESYYALVPDDADKTRSLRAFVRWLVAEGSGKAGD